jgi:hypothetical protein
LTLFTSARKQGAAGKAGRKPENVGSVPGFTTPARSPARSRSPAATFPPAAREAYLAAHQGADAANEFQKILNHRGVVINDPIGALSHLQLGRSLAMSGDKTKARAAYQDFLALWKDADSDIPILKQAKAEFAKLMQ